MHRVNTLNIMWLNLNSCHDHPFPPSPKSIYCFRLRFESRNAVWFRQSPQHHCHWCAGCQHRDSCRSVGIYVHVATVSHINIANVLVTFQVAMNYTTSVVIKDQDDTFYQEMTIVYRGYLKRNELTIANSGLISMLRRATIRSRGLVCGCYRLC